MFRRRKTKTVRPLTRTYLPRDPAGWESFWLAREDVVNGVLPGLLERLRNLEEDLQHTPQIIEQIKWRIYRTLQWCDEDIEWFFAEGPYDDRGPLWDRSCRHYTFADLLR